jgi:hypothetical protein
MHKTDYKRLPLAQYSLGDHKATNKAADALAYNEITVIIPSSVISISSSLAMVNRATQSLNQLPGPCPLPLVRLRIGAQSHDVGTSVSFR